MGPRHHNFFKSSPSELDTQPGLKTTDGEQGLEQRKKSSKVIQCFPHLSDNKNHLKCLLEEKKEEERKKNSQVSPLLTDLVDWRWDQGICLFDNFSNVGLIGTTSPIGELLIGVLNQGQVVAVGMKARLCQATQNWKRLNFQHYLYLLLYTASLKSTKTTKFEYGLLS